MTQWQMLEWGADFDASGGDGDGDGGFDPRRGGVLFEDWVNGLTAGEASWTIMSNGTASGAAIVPSEANRQGIVELRAGTVAGGRGGVRLAQGFATVPASVPGRPNVMQWSIRIPTLSDATRSFFVNVGFSDNTTGGQGSDSLAFRYDNADPLTATWRAFSRKSGVETANIDTGIPVSTNWLTLRIEVDVTEARFYIGPSPGVTALVASIPVAQIPSFVESSGFEAIIQGQVGVLQRTMLVDYFYYQYFVDR